MVFLGTSPIFDCEGKVRKQQVRANTLLLVMITVVSLLLHNVAACYACKRYWANLYGFVAAAPQRSRLLLTSTQSPNRETDKLKNPYKVARLFNQLPPRFIPAEFMGLASQCDRRASTVKWV